MKHNRIITVMALSILLMLGLNVKAQDGKILVGGGLAYGTDINKAGLFVHGTYKITSEWEGSADFTYFLPETKKGQYYKTSWNWSALNLNAHYVFYSENKIEVYGLAGLSMLFSNAKWEYSGPQSAYYQGSNNESNSNSDAGFNLGAGARYLISDRLSGMAEVKYSITSERYLQISAGILYSF